MKKSFQEQSVKPITDADETEAYIGSRGQVLNRSWPTLLWMEVIKKAEEDLALFIRMHEDGEKLSDEDKFHADTAYGFLFDPEYTIWLGNTEITLEELLENWYSVKSMEQWREKQWIKIREKVKRKRTALQTRRIRQKEKDNGVKKY